MDMLISTGKVAEAMGTTRSRIHRAVGAGIVDPTRTAGGHLRWNAADIDTLRRRIGYVPKLSGLSRTETLVLAALGRRPFGLASARAVSRACGVSPTAAADSLRRLRRRHLVRRTHHRTVAGRATAIAVWELNPRHPMWIRLASTLARLDLPADIIRARLSRPRPVPVYLRHLFWNVDPRLVDTERDGSFIAGRVLESNDPQAHAWAVSALEPGAFRRAAQIRGVPRDRAATARRLGRAEPQQFLDARRQHPVEDIELIHGMPVAGLGDLLATKLNAIGGRGALRDYFDLLVLDRDEGRRIEEGLILFVERYRPEVPSASVTHLVHSLGYMDDVEDDPGLPMSRADIEDYWDRRQPEVFRSLDRLGL